MLAGDEITAAICGRPSTVLPSLHELDAVARFFERLEIGDDFVPIEQLVIDADFVAEVAFGSGHRGEGRNNQEKCGQESGGHGLLYYWKISAGKISMASSGTAKCVASISFSSQVYKRFE